MATSVPRQKRMGVTLVDVARVWGAGSSSTVETSPPSRVATMTLASIARGRLSQRTAAFAAYTVGVTGPSAVKAASQGSSLCSDLAVGDVGQGSDG